MNRVLSTLAAMCFSFAAAGASLDDCEKPSVPSGVPDGAAASQSEMIEAQGAVKSFVDEGQAYVSCVQKVIQEVEAEVKAAASEKNEERTAEQQALAQKRQKLVQLHNGMVDAMKKVASDFNEALQAYNKANAE